MRADDFRIIEEVPGVPASERYFVTGPGLSYPYPAFATQAEAQGFLDQRGVRDYSFEPFAP